ncbi:5-oxoprolinase subunit PxpB [Metabacillus fastidiosus]|uniref:5-oxoprolinase subunit PxpB n=1 Tax=Metabacillus fastidiosus TaxID=1458 RepID=UPI002E250DF4|nr:5-oxoprolinase subunit PxpB [Metabacillus fastidiosus]MED4533008.1 5-oxoprolinase subunit PxpB [Metabacillus fastidiosus]
MGEIKIKSFGDSAVMIKVGEQSNIETSRRIKIISEQIDQQRFDGLTEVVPGLTTVTIYYNPFTMYQLYGESPFRFIHEKLTPIVNKAVYYRENNSRIMTIPVCYEEELGPDLEAVSIYHQISKAELIALHSGQDYVVHMIGFAPGFPYLGGLCKEIVTPRKASPRTHIPAGSVGIGGEQTGIYPIESPGGWNIIGKTPLELFRPDDEVPSLLRAGDIVRFQPITFKEFQSLNGAASF